MLFASSGMHLFPIATIGRLDPANGMSLMEKQIYDNIRSAIAAIIQRKSGVLVHAGDCG